MKFTKLKITWVVLAAGLLGFSSIGRAESGSSSFVIELNPQQVPISIPDNPGFMVYVLAGGYCMPDMSLPNAGNIRTPKMIFTGTLQPTAIWSRSEDGSLPTFPVVLDSKKVLHSVGLKKIGETLTNTNLVRKLADVKCGKNEPAEAAILIRLESQLGGWRSPYYIFPLADFQKEALTREEAVGSESLAMKSYLVTDGTP